jgi:hypothetical protein
MIMPVASLLRRSPALASSVFAAFLLVGCTQMGTYQDAPQPDAAKLRFVANADNATLSYFDAEHCDGLTTGTLNNLFIAASQRRVGMSVAPPEKTRGYLEIKLPPEKDMYLKVNTQTGYSTCGPGFSFKPQAGGEYELSLSVTGSQCKTLMQRVQRIDGKDVRTPLVLKRDSLPACYGRNALFPTPPKLLPDTPERTAMMDRIIAGSMYVRMTSDATKDKAAGTSPEKLDELIGKRKAKLGFTLPDEYWTLYRQNLGTFNQDVADKKTLVLQRSSEEYRRRLRSADDKQLKAWAGAGDAAKPLNAAPAELEKDMIMFYFQTDREVTVETISRHLDRMAKMEQQYDVCSRYADCWKRL